MKQSLASAPPRTWNEKNLPVEPAGETAGALRELIAQVPSAAAGFAQRNRGALVLSVAALVAAVLVGYFFSKKE